MSVGRTKLHSKTLQYWLDWFHYKTKLHVGNKTFTLLHFDYHANEDISHDQIHSCSPSQLIYYHQLVDQLLESTHYILDIINKHKEIKIKNLTNYVYQFGYINTIIWIYPDHWINYSKQFIHGLNYHRFRNLVHNMTYYVTPIGNHDYTYFFQSDNLTIEEINFFQTKLSTSKTITSQLHEAYDETKSIQFNIYAMSLSELQELINFDTKNDQHIFFKNSVILDIDLDFFVCQSPSETLREYFNWDNDELISTFNTYLSHHQYSPSHIHTQDIHYAMLVLLHQLSTNQSETKLHNTGLRSDDMYTHKLDEPLNVDKMKDDLPTISNIINHAIEYGLSPMELQNLLYHLYRFHIEIGDSRFVEHVQDYIHSHQHLDIYLNGSPQTDHNSMHKLIAEMMNTNINDVDSLIVNVSINEFGEINKDINYHSNYDKIEQWVQTHQQLNSIIMNDTEDVMENSLISQLVQQLRNNGEIYKLTPDLFFEIEQDLLHNKHVNLSYWLDIVSNTKPINDIVLWDPGHEQFIRAIELQYGRIPETPDQITYSATLNQLQISGDYLYLEWQNILKHYNISDSIVDFKSKWQHKYVDNDNYSYYHESDNDIYNDLSTNNLSTIIPWNSLDPVQKHFLRKSNHSLLENLISSLTVHQQKFLHWLIFCYLHGSICENGHSAIHLLDESDEKYQKFKNIDWGNMNEYPALVSSDDHDEILQFSTSYHGLKEDWLGDKESEKQFISSNIDQNINKFHSILSNNNFSILTIGIEMSYAHIPRNIHEWLECEVSFVLHNIFQFEDSHFIRFQTFEGDEKVTHPTCIDPLIYLLDRKVIENDNDKIRINLNEEDLKMFNDY